MLLEDVNVTFGSLYVQNFPMPNMILHRHMARLAMRQLGYVVEQEKKRMNTIASVTFTHMQTHLVT